MNPRDDSRHEDHAEYRAGAIVDLAFGQPVEAQISEAIRRCPGCARELHEHERTIALIRSGAQGADRTPKPPASVWAGIASELHLDSASASAVTGAQPPVPDSPDRTPDAGPENATSVESRRITRRRFVGAAASVVLLGGAGAIGYAVGARRSGTAPPPEAHAPLRPQPGTSERAGGSVTVRASDNGRAVDVRTSGLPAVAGYYEVWLFDPAANKMVAIGTLGTGYAGTFTVPNGLDLTKFHVVDVSDQKLNGDNTHQRSVLRGTLR